MLLRMPWRRLGRMFALSKRRSEADVMQCGVQTRWIPMKSTRSLTHGDETRIVVGRDGFLVEADLDIVSQFGDGLAHQNEAHGSKLDRLKSLLVA